MTPVLQIIELMERKLGRATFDDAGELDEFTAANVSVHIERLSDGAWWMSIERAGRAVVINLTSRSPITPDMREEEFSSLKGIKIEGPFAVNVSEDGKQTVKRKPGRMSTSQKIAQRKSKKIRPTKRIKWSQAP